MSELKFEPWRHFELIAANEVLRSIADGYFDRSADSIKEIENSILRMMQNAKESRINRLKRTGERK